MNTLEVRGLSFSVGDFIMDVDELNVPDTDYFMVMGPTGAGKSLLLKAIAGLIVPSAGTVRIKDKNVTSFEPRARNVGYVPQNSGLFPHLNVRENLEFPLRLKRTTPESVSLEIDRISEALQIAPLMTRDTATLSGGESQKVALARALLCKPDLLLLDEPVSALDSESKRDTCSVLKSVHQQYGITTLHVCHNRTEALALGSHAVLMRDGSIAAGGAPADVLPEDDLLELTGNEHHE
jgi:ABC-type sugar transport system ATPase subunit